MQIVGHAELCASDSQIKLPLIGNNFAASTAAFAAGGMQGGPCVGKGTSLV